MQVQINEELTTLFGLSPAEVAFVAPLVTDALIANYAGDEEISQATLGMINYFLSQDPPINQLGMLLLGIWTDLYPADNELVIPVSASDPSRPGLP